MGWSATASACSVMEAIKEYCKQSGDATNEWTYKGSQYFVELGQEYNDGHISMVIWKTIKQEGDRLTCKQSGTIYINPDGKIRRMPKYLKTAIKPYLRFDHLYGIDKAAFIDYVCA